MEIIRHTYSTPNVGQTERSASVIAGCMMMYHGLREKTWKGAGLALLGTAFIRRGITGFCYSYQTLGITTAKLKQGASLPYELGIRVDESVTINRPREEVYAFWRNLENLAEFMEHVESVRIDGASGRSHWVAKGPGGKRLEWEAAIVNDIRNELIAWRSLEGSDVPNAGSVHFTDAAGGRGTEVRVELQYNPPGGTLGALAAKLFGSEPSSEIHKDLARLKTRLEAGVMPTTEGQSVGGRTTDDKEHQKKSEQVVAASEESFPASDSPAYSH